MPESIEAADGTLVAATVSTVTATGTHIGVEIMNVSGSAAIGYTIDGTAPTSTTSPEIPAVAGSKVRIPFGSNVTAAVVKLLSAGTPTYSVEFLDELELNAGSEV